MSYLKLAIISPGIKPVPAVEGGAVEQLIQTFIEGNEKVHKYDIDLYTIDNDKLKNFKYQYTNVIRIPIKPKFGLVFKVYNKLRNIFSILTKKDRVFNYYMSKVKKIYKTNYYDLVLVENIMDNYLHLMPKFDNEKTYFHLHNDLENDPHSMITGAKARIILDNVDVFFVVSVFLKKRILKLDKSKRKKIKVVYNGLTQKNFQPVSLDERRNLRKKFAIAENDMVFTYVGTLSKVKGIEEFIRAAQSFKKQKNIKFLITGQDILKKDTKDQYILYLKKIASVVKNQIIFTGYIDNKKVKNIYSISDCIVIPTQIEETFGMVALEAMTMGVPVISSISGGLPEVLSKDSAIFVKKDNNFVVNLSKAMLTVKDNSKLRIKMSEAGKRQSKKFPTDNVKYFLSIAQKM